MSALRAQASFAFHAQRGSQKRTALSIFEVAKDISPIELNGCAGKPDAGLARRVDPLGVNREHLPYAPGSHGAFKLCGNALYARAHFWSVDDDYSRIDLTLGVIRADSGPDENPYMTVTSESENLARHAFTLATLTPGATMTISDGSTRGIGITNVDGAHYIMLAHDAEDVIGEVTLERPQIERLVDDWLRSTGR